MTTCQNIAPSPFILAKKHIHRHYKPLTWTPARYIQQSKWCDMSWSLTLPNWTSRMSSWFGKFEVIVCCVISLALPSANRMHHANICAPFSLQWLLDCNFSKCYVVGNRHNSPKLWEKLCKSHYKCYKCLVSERDLRCDSFQSLADF